MTGGWLSGKVTLTAFNERGGKGYDLQRRLQLVRKVLDRRGRRILLGVCDGRKVQVRTLFFPFGCGAGIQQILSLTIPLLNVICSFSELK